MSPTETAPTKVWAVVAGGGTVGHVNPGVGIARALVNRGHDPSTIHFIGSERGVEATRVPDAGFEVTLLPGRGIQRSLTTDNVGALVGLAQAQASALRLLRELDPAVVVSMGGYASVPAALAAAALRIPVVVAEQNAVPGAANRLVSRFAKACAVSFSGTDLPKAVLTGNPVRAEILAIDRARDRAAARQRLGIPLDRTLIFSFGGSLGARHINRSLVDVARRWSHRSDLAIRHVIGDRDWELFKAEFPTDGELIYQAVRYEEDVPSALAAADLFIGRGGATTVAELAAIGIGSILIPLPTAPGDHQTANARALERVGAAQILADGDMSSDSLETAMTSLLTDPARLAAMGTAAAGVSRRDAAERVADLVERHASRPGDERPTRDVTNE